MFFLLPASYREAFSDEFTFHDNPLATLERRRSERRLSDKVILAICLSAMLGSMILTLWIWDRAQFITRHIPAFLGDNYGSMLFIAVSGVHVWFVSYTAHRRTNSYFLQEYRRGSLQALLSTSFTPFQLVLQASVFPFLQAMLVAAAGLPFYAYFLHLGGISLVEVTVVLLVFAMMAFAPPRWRVPVFGGLAPQDIQRRKKRGRGTTAAELAVIFFIALVFTSWMLDPLLGSGWFWALLAPLNDLFEKRVAVFWPTVIISWPFMLARWMMTAIPFYSIKLPPILFVLPLYCLAQVLGIWHTSIYLRIEDEKQAERLWDLPAFWRLRMSYSLLLGFAALGFCWKPYVASKITASIFALRFSQPGQELAGLLWLAGLLAALMFWERIFRFRQANASLLNPLGAKYIAAEMRWCLPPLIGMYGLYVVGCLLARQMPFPPAALAILPGQLASTLTGALLIRSLAVGRGLYVLLLALPLVACLFPGCSPAAGLSPLGGFLALTPHTQRIANILSPFQPTILGWYFLAGVGFSVGISMNFLLFSGRRVAQRYDSAVLVSEAEPEFEIEPPRLSRRFREKREQPIAQSIIRWLQGRFDNAVAVKELRVLLRGRLGQGDLMTYGTLFLVPIIAAAARPDILRAVMDIPSQLFYGSSLGASGGFFAELSTLYCFVTALIFPLMMAYSAATAFGKERDRSTLGFVLITPLHTGAIILGKLVGLLLPGGLALLSAIVINLVLAFAVGSLAGMASALPGVFLTTAIPILLSFAGAMLGLLFASLLRKETDAGSLALFSICSFVGVVFYVDYRAGGMEGRASMVEATAFWVLSLAILTAVISVICGLLAYARVEMMRGGDITFGPGGKR